MQVFVDANICWDPCKRDLEWAFLFYRKNEHPEKKLMSCYIPDLPLYHFCCLFLCHGDHCGETNLLISARPQRQTNVRRCRIFGDLDQLKSKDTIQKKRQTDLHGEERKGNKTTVKLTKVQCIFARYFGLKNKPSTGKYIVLVLISLLYFLFLPSPWGSVYRFLYNIFWF